MSTSLPPADAGTAGGTSTSRPIPLRARPDVVVSRQFTDGDELYVLKNPLDLQYHQLLAEEYFLWRLLDGQASLDRLRRAFEQRFVPQRITVAEVQRLLTMLHERNLVLSIAPRQGEQLHRRRGEKFRRELRQMLANPLALRFRGIDPDRMFGALERALGFVFRPAGVCLWLLVVVAACLVVVSHWSAIVEQTIRAEDFLTPSHLAALAVAMAAVKVIHEFGHGIACKHFGGEVRELGLMLLVFTPCLYCNASDSWLFVSKWRRAAVAAAGMYFEGFLAAGAILIWWCAHPGALRDAALDVAVVCSLSTLVLNGNPLLRFDGYYILSDLLETPALAEKASLWWRRRLGTACLGIEYPPDYRLAACSPRLLAVYGAAAWVYRWFVSLSILLFLYAVLKQYRLTPVFYLIAGYSFAPKIVPGLKRIFNMLTKPGSRSLWKPRRAAMTAAVVVAALAMIAFVPIEDYVYCPVEIVPRDESLVFAETSGVLLETDAQFGRQVRRGDRLLRLDDVDLRREQSRLESQCAEYRAVLAGLERNQFADRQLASEIAITRKALAASEELLAKRTADVRRLEIVASRAGVVLPPPELQAEQPSADGLKTWSGGVFEPHNLGCYVEEGTLLCRVGEPREVEAELVIEHRDWELVAAGQSVEVLLDALPLEPLAGRVGELGQANLRLTPKRLSHAGGGELASKTDADGVQRPRHTSYFARASLTFDAETTLPLGARGTAKVHVGRTTLPAKLERFLRNFFTFRL